jgi:archaellum component FlaF (FlaF/FlaG flagellin family)
MGLGTSVAVIIILLGATGAIVVSYPAFVDGIQSVSEAFMAQGSFYEGRRGTSLAVENITVEGTCALYNLTILLNNSGNQGITIGMLSIFDNGETLENALGGLLAPHKGINITYENMTSEASGHRIVVVTENGVPAYGTYAC